MRKHLQHKTAPDGNFYQVLENVSEQGLERQRLLMLENCFSQKHTDVSLQLESSPLVTCLRLPGLWVLIQRCPKRLTVAVTKLAWPVCTAATLGSFGDIF